MAEAMQPTRAGDAAARMPILSPQELAPHFPQLEIIDCLGRGGMGVVYKARQKSLNRLVALKLLAPERADDPQFAARFAKEAQALAAMNHPHIVGVHDFGQAGGFFYLLMEFVDGVNLRQAMAAGRFTPEQALAVVPPVCEALQYAHEHGIVHRDIKPENLLLDKAGRVKIADFGIAKMLVGDDASPDVTPHGGPVDESTLASLAGTPQYMAPEQKAHGVTDHRADIYALGVVLYELLTGELPADMLQPPSRKVRIDVRLDEIVLRALEKTPERRYQTAVEFRTQVETVVSSSRENEALKSTRTTPQTAANPSPLTSAVTTRFSRTAIVGACWIPLAIAALAFVAFEPHHAFPYGFNGLGLAATIPNLAGIFGTTILGWIAVSQIRRSAGKLDGLGLAVCDGLLFPLLLVDGVFVWVVRGLVQIFVELNANFTNLGYPHSQPSFITQLANLLARLPAFSLLIAVFTSVIVDWLIVRRVWRAVNRPLHSQPVTDPAGAPNTVRLAHDIVADGSGQDARATGGAGILPAASSFIPAAASTKRPVMAGAPVALPNSTLSNVASGCAWMSAFFAAITWSTFLFTHRPPEVLRWFLLIAALVAVALAIPVRKSPQGRWALWFAAIQAVVWMFCAVFVPFTEQLSPTEARAAIEQALKQEITVKLNASSERFTGLSVALDPEAKTAAVNLDGLQEMRGIDGSNVWVDIDGSLKVFNNGGDWIVQGDGPLGFIKFTVPLQDLTHAAEIDQKRSRHPLLVELRESIEGLKKRIAQQAGGAMTSSSFGPVIEREIAFHGACLNLLTATVTPMSDLPGANEARKLHGDVFQPASESNLNALAILDVAVLDLDAVAWDDLSASALQEKFAQADSGKRSSRGFSETRIPPGVYGFSGYNKTGILHVLGMSESKAGGFSGVKIRYKLVQADQQAPQLRYLAWQHENLPTLFGNDPAHIKAWHADGSPVDALEEKQQLARHLPTLINLEHTADGKGSRILDFWFTHDGAQAQLDCRLTLTDTAGQPLPACLEGNHLSYQPNATAGTNWFSCAKVVSPGNELPPLVNVTLTYAGAWQNAGIAVPPDFKGSFQTERDAITLISQTATGHVVVTTEKKRGANDPQRKWELRAETLDGQLLAPASIEGTDVQHIEFAAPLNRIKEFRLGFQELQEIEFRNVPTAAQAPPKSSEPEANAAPTFESVTGAAKQLIFKYFPDAVITIKDDEFKARHGTREFEIHAMSKAGEPAQEAHKETGPTTKGFMLVVRRQSELSQLEMPQFYSEPYWKGYANLAIDPKSGQGLAAYFDFGAGLNPEFKAAMLELLKLSGSNPTKPDAAATPAIAPPTHSGVLSEKTRKMADALLPNIGEIKQQAAVRITQQQVAQLEALLKKGPLTEDKLAVIWEHDETSGSSYRQRADVVAIPILPVEKSPLDSIPLGEVLHHVGDTTFYIQWDAMGSSTHHYYGPYHHFDEITKVLGLKLTNGGNVPKPGATSPVSQQLRAFQVGSKDAVLSETTRNGGPQPSSLSDGESSERAVRLGEQMMAMVRVPLELVQADICSDGGTIGIVFKDAEARTLELCVDHQEETQTHGRLYVGAIHPTKPNAILVESGGTVEKNALTLLTEWLAQHAPTDVDDHLADAAEIARRDKAEAQRKLVRQVWETLEQRNPAKTKTGEPPLKSLPPPVDARRHPATELFINNHKFGDDNGCAATVVPSGQATCGHPGHVSEITWKFLRTDGDGDVYQITRRYPSDAATANTDTKECTYAGKALTLWADDTQKIILRPKPPVTSDNEAGRSESHPADCGKIPPSS